MALNIFKKDTKATGNKKEKPEEKILSESRVAAKKEGTKKIEGAWKILKTAHITEKATDLSVLDQYVFNVYPGANKKDVAKAVESTYKVNVVSVNVVNIPPKKIRVGRTFGRKPGYKKAIVSVAKGQKIELMPR